MLGTFAFAVIVILDKEAIGFFDILIEAPASYEAPNLVRFSPEAGPRSISSKSSDARIIVNELACVLGENAVKAKDICAVALYLIRRAV